MAIAPIVAAAASGHHQRSGRSDSGTPAFFASVLCGPAPISRRAAARIASSSAAGGSSREAARHAASTRVSRRSFGSCVLTPRPPHRSDCPVSLGVGLPQSLADAPFGPWLRPARSFEIPQLRAQLRERVADAALHGLDADARERRDFGELEPAFLMQQERLALRGGQRGERLLADAPPISRAPARTSGSSARAPGIASSGSSSSSRRR